MAGKKAKKGPPKRRKSKKVSETLSLIGGVIGINNLDGAVVQDCLFRVTEKEAPVCVLIQGLEFRQVGSLLVIQPKPSATIEAAM